MPSWKLVLATMGIGTLAAICMVGVAYAMVKVPTVNSSSTEQGATVYWNDGKTQMLKIGSSRTVVPLSKISKPMQQAVVSVEDRNFYHESAVSPIGITRAFINDLKGGPTQGGSTITQQYVKNAYLNQEQTISRKFKEIFISVKVGKQQDKDMILQNYLNTISFGRGANGVEAAAEAYYGKHAIDLTVPEAAILASQPKSPGYYDPVNPVMKSHLQLTINRYNIVLQAMVRSGAISQTDYLKYKDHLPKVKAVPKGNALGGQKGFLYERVKNALSGMGYSEQQIEQGGLKVYTTWDEALQKQAQQTVEADLKAHRMPKDTRVGLVTMDPTKGEILAAYGGADFVKRQVDDAYYSTAQVGSSFKPYVLAAALKNGISLKTVMNGTSPQYFNTKGDSVSPGQGGTRFINDEANAPNPYVNLVQATADSLNTVYVPLGYKAGWQDVYDLAKAAGLPKQGLQDGHPGEGGFFLGQSDIAPVYQASGYSTIANDGKYITPHSIRYVIEPSGKTKRPKIEHNNAVFGSDSVGVAHDVQYAMQAVVTRGTGKNAAVPGREVAGKTGTTNQNVAAWFSGFTPKQLVTTIGMWRFQDRTKKHAAKTIPAAERRRLSRDQRW
jgi:membrane peptidoglycan carboxypeptidase